MLDHLGVQVADVEASVAFYLRCFAALGFREAKRFPVPDAAGAESAVVGLAGPDGFPRFWVSPARGDEAREIHVAFSAQDRAAVDAVGEAAVAAGAEVLHAPRVFPEYHPATTGCSCATSTGTTSKPCTTAAERAPGLSSGARTRQAGRVSDDRNVLGTELQECSNDPLTGFYRDGCCTVGPEDVGNHSVCAVLSAEFLNSQQVAGNDLITPHPELGFPGLEAGDRWCVVAARWLQAHERGFAPGVVLAATNARVLEVIPLELLQQFSVDTPDDVSALG